MSKDNEYMEDRYKKREIYIIDDINQHITFLQKKINLLTHYTLLIEASRTLENRDLINLFENMYHDVIDCLLID